MRITNLTFIFALLTTSTALSKAPAGESVSLPATVFNRTAPELALTDLGKICLREARLQQAHLTSISGIQFREQFAKWSVQASCELSFETREAL